MQPRAVVLLATVFCLLGCPASVEQPKFRDFADRYYQTLRDEPFEQALPLYEARFFDTTPQLEWQEKLEQTRQRFGQLESWQQAKWSMEMLPNGTFVTFEYDVTYASERRREILTIVAPRETDSLYVFGHHIRGPSPNP